MGRHRGDYCSTAANLQISKEKEHSECYGFEPVYLHIKHYLEEKKNRRPYNGHIL